MQARGSLGHRHAEKLRQELYEPGIGVGEGQPAPGGRLNPTEREAAPVQIIDDDHAVAILDPADVGRQDVGAVGLWGGHHSFLMLIKRSSGCLAARSSAERSASQASATVSWPSCRSSPVAAVTRVMIAQVIVGAGRVRAGMVDVTAAGAVIPAETISAARLVADIQAAHALDGDWIERKGCMRHVYLSEPHVQAHASPAFFQQVAGVHRAVRRDDQCVLSHRAETDLTALGVCGREHRRDIAAGQPAPRRVEALRKYKGIRWGEPCSRRKRCGLQRLEADLARPERRAEPLRDLSSRGAVSWVTQARSTSRLEPSDRMAALRITISDVRPPFNVGRCRFWISGGPSSDSTTASKLSAIQRQRAALKRPLVVTSKRQLRPSSWLRSLA